MNRSEHRNFAVSVLGVDAAFYDSLNAKIRCYDNGGKTSDRYTVVFMDQPERAHNTFSALGMNSQPFHGIGMHCSAMPGKHLGRRVLLQDLPTDCQKAVKQALQP
jgi:hypothetical protein